MRWIFYSQELDIWTDGRVRQLMPGTDYPPETAPEVVIRRLQVAARRRGCSCRAWPQEGGVRFVMLALGTAGGRVLEPGE